MPVTKPELNLSVDTAAIELECIADTDMEARYAALLTVHQERCQELEALSARYKDLKRVHQSLVEQREQDRQQILRYATGLVSASRPGIHTSRIIRLTGSPKILALYLRIMRTPGLGQLLRIVRRIAIKILARR